ncbi:hypothetical protein [Acetobacterium sp.]
MKTLILARGTIDKKHFAYFFPSQAWIYKPIRKPRGIVQIVHGFGEHSQR